MSRALLSEACERDESCRCLPSGLGTSTTECVLWEGCVLGGLVLIRLQRKGECSLIWVISRGNRRKAQEMV